MRPYILLYVAAMVGACSQPADMTFGGKRTPIDLTQTEVELVQRSVREAMMGKSRVASLTASAISSPAADPASARFDGMVAGTTPRGYIVVCGWVNGKNGRGSYIGRQRFAGELVRDPTPTYYLNYIASDERKAILVRSICGTLPSSA